MITFFHFFRLAIHNLRRGGQRALVALLCIAFGIMALVAMNMVANCISSAVQLTPAQILGGDMSIGRKEEDTLRPQDLKQLEKLKQSGEISRYTLIAFRSSIMFHTPNSGEMHFIGTGMGIEPNQYPLAGSLVIGEPGNTGLPALLQQNGDLVVTRDIAEQYHLKVGDTIILADPGVGVPLRGTLRGIAYDTPNHYGDKIYYSLATAQKLANGQPVINTVIANTKQARTVAGELESSGWSVDWGRDGKTGNLWVFGLRGAGILGLLVGGIGIANTMQVLLRRRRREIAIWKTLGYRQSDLRWIFSLEAGLLGLAGSLLGAGIGVLLSSGLLELFRRTSTLLYAWTFSPMPPLMGILIGTLTTVIFAYWAIVISSQARPVAILRNEPIDLQQLSGCKSVRLGILLASLFTALTSLVMGSVLAGIGVLVGILIGIAVLGGFFKALLWIFPHLIPQRKFPLLLMAVNSMHRNGTTLVFAMIALFIGVLSMSLGLAVVQISERRISGGPVDFQSYNLDILASGDQERAIRQAIQLFNPEKVGVGYRTVLASLSIAGKGQLVSNTVALLVGRSDPADYVVRGAAWGSQPEGVYAYKWANLEIGSQVVVAFRDGTTKTFPVVGTYDINYRSLNLYPPTGLLMTAQGFTQVTQPDSLIYFVQVAPDQVSRAAADLTISLPQSTVINLVAYAARFIQSYQNLYILAIAMAGLALLAGFLLVGNSVSLAMLDHHYEIGILKTVGYSHRQILSIFTAEYGLASLLATGTGMLLIQGLLAVVAIANHLAIAMLILNLPSLVFTTFCGVGLTLLTVFGISWSPTRVSPILILNERD